jgi:hypothetical protein
MPMVKILEDYGASEGWGKGDIADISNPERLIAEGKVELYVKKAKADSDNSDSKGVRAKASKKKSK